MAVPFNNYTNVSIGTAQNFMDTINANWGANGVLVTNQGLINTEFARVDGDIATINANAATAGSVDYKVNAATTALVGNASTNYNTLGKIETGKMTKPMTFVYSSGSIEMNGSTKVYDVTNIISAGYGVEVAPDQWQTYLTAKTKVDITVVGQGLLNLSDAGAAGIYVVNNNGTCTLTMVEDGTDGVTFPANTIQFCCYETV